MNPSETNTNEQINRKLHEAMGGHVCRDFSLGVCVKCRQSTWPNGVPVPDYCTDLNVAFDAQAFVIERVGRWDYADALFKIVLADRGILTDESPYSCLDQYDLASMAAASAEQRALACLKALGVEP